MGWDGMGLFMESWMGDDGVGSSEKQGIRICFWWRSFYFLGLEYSWLALGSVGLAWLLGGEAVPRKED